MHMTMALSSRAHAFSVEALVGKSAKRKLLDIKHEKLQDQVLFQSDEKAENRETHESAEMGKKQKQESLSPTHKNRKTLEPKSGIHVELQGSELWKRFHEIGTEMIITKAGRRMFPSVRVKIKGLDPVKQYYIAMDVVPVDSKRYRYVYHSSQWMVAGNTDHSCITPRLYIHPDSPCSGETWTRQIVNFDRVKLTNNEMDDKGHIILQSMHKYKVRVHVITQDCQYDQSQIQTLPTEGVYTFSFKETEFTTVTAYQNQQITKLKIDRNPFAKGFRDPGRNRGILDGLLETYPWRTPLTLDFKTFGGETQGGSSGTSPVASSGGTPSPLKSLLSPACSPNSFHLTSNVGIPSTETHFPNLSLQPCYKVCPSNVLGQPFLLHDLEKFGSSGSSALPSIMVDHPFFSTVNISNIGNKRTEDFNLQCLQPQCSSEQMVYGLPTTRNSGLVTAPVNQAALSCSLHSPYGLCSYNFTLSSRLTNSSNHFKLTDNIPVSFRDSKYSPFQWYSSINCL
ncbi:T-box transcription factor TBX22 [Protopterus annectens]|uniref:T-box transcription factor TBX22 n=1 Tax=Protopterus annectens TaxID=7888 RepID=UPI001CF9339F|nr:T-box transcription factor TBX22 [Protopterus annectens]